MISIEKKFLFIHVPKTGGNSIQQVLSEYSDDRLIINDKRQDGIERFEVMNGLYKTTKHSSLSQYKRSIDKKTFSQLFKFATMRNPWDMMVSQYFSPHRKNLEWNREKFRKLVFKVKPLRHYICDYHPLLDLRKMIGLKNGRHLLDEIDFLIRFEHLQEDFDNVSLKLGLPLRELPKMNASKKVHYSEYYDENLKELVARRFAEEIEIGNYEY